MPPKSCTSTDSCDPRPANAAQNPAGNGAPSDHNAAPNPSLRVVTDVQSESIADDGSAGGGVRIDTAAQTEWDALIRNQGAGN